MNTLKKPAKTSTLKEQGETSVETTNVFLS